MSACIVITRGSRWREANQNLKLKIVALYYASQDDEMPWQAKALALAIVAYGLSPIDLIPDFIPFVGYLDDLVVIPLGIWFVIRMIPPHVMDAALRKAATTPRIDRTLGLVGAAFMLALYALLVWMALHYFLRVPQ